VERRSVEAGTAGLSRSGPMFAESKPLHMGVDLVHLDPAHDGIRWS
jgi:hypothetical protein